MLCDLQEMSYAEAADVLACAVGAVGSRLHRGRQLLATKLSAADHRLRFPGSNKTGRCGGEAGAGETARVESSKLQELRMTCRECRI